MQHAMSLRQHQPPLAHTRLPAGTAAGLHDRIRASLPELSRQFQIIGNFCLLNAEYLHLMRIEDVSASCKARPSTIVRFAKRFGMNGFKALKIAFLEEPQDRQPLAAHPAPRHDGMESSILALSTSSRVLILGDDFETPLTAYLQYALTCLGKTVKVLPIDSYLQEASPATSRPDALILAALSSEPDREACLARQAGMDECHLITICRNRITSSHHSMADDSPLKVLTRALEAAQQLIEGVESRRTSPIQ
ncbi:MAG: hypothetical protein RJA36_3043 [Pseudomonadota bacterium]|jgi:DNA-binding MurR/RpiR family transcriptional regulator